MYGLGQVAALARRSTAAAVQAAASGNVATADALLAQAQQLIAQARTAIRGGGGPVPVVGVAQSVLRPPPADADAVAWANLGDRNMWPSLASRAFRARYRAQWAAQNASRLGSYYDDY